MTILYYSVRRSLRLHCEKVIFNEKVFFCSLVSSPPNLNKYCELRDQIEIENVSCMFSFASRSNVATLTHDGARVHCVAFTPSENVEKLSVFVQKVWRRRSCHERVPLKPGTMRDDEKQLPAAAKSE